MALGPIQYLVLNFENPQQLGKIVDQLVDVTDRGFIRVIDILFVRKHADGEIEVVELDDLDDAGGFDKLVNETLSLLSDDDLLELAADMPPNTADAVLIFEHVWAKGLGDAIINAGGRLMDSGFVPKAIVDAAESYALSVNE